MTVSDWGRGGGTPRTFNGLSLAVFVVTGIVWLVQHFAKWPGGYLPWMLSVAFLLFAVGSTLKLHQMRN